MRKIGAVIAAIILVGSVAGVALAQDFTYVGVQKCQICHKTEKQGQQFLLWQQSKHSKSFEALSKPEAAEKAKAMSCTMPPPDSPMCLKCHSPLAAKAAELKAEGVTCEVCHGPGSAYKSLSVMKDKAAAQKAGLVLYGSPEKIKAQCLTCHENAHGTTFDFDANWAKIKHPVPAK